MNARRILTVVAAILFVASVALATAGPRMMSLGGVVTHFNGHGVESLHSWVLRVAGPWVWIYVVQPLLVRPAWLPLGSLGLICAGVAISLPAGNAASRSRRQS